MKKLILLSLVLALSVNLEAIALATPTNAANSAGLDHQQRDHLGLLAGQIDMCFGQGGTAKPLCKWSDADFIWIGLQLCDGEHLTASTSGALT